MRHKSILKGPPLVHPEVPSATCLFPSLSPPPLTQPPAPPQPTTSSSWSPRAATLGSGRPIGDGRPAEILSQSLVYNNSSATRRDDE